MKETMQDNATLFEIGTRCNKLREEHNKTRILSQREFAKIIGVTHNNISLIESGKKRMTMSELLSYQRECNVSADYLLGLTETESTDNVDKMINKQLGLSDDAIKNLRFFADTKKSRIIKNKFTSIVNLFLGGNYFFELIITLTDICNYDPNDKIAIYRESSDNVQAFFIDKKQNQDISMPSINIQDTIKHRFVEQCSKCFDTIQKNIFEQKESGE